MTAQFAAGGALVPFVTLVLRDRGLDFRHVSLVFAASSATLLVTPLLWGMLADRFMPLNRLFTVLNLAACTALMVFVSQESFLGCLLGYTAFFACYSPLLTLINAMGFHHLPHPREQFGRLRSWGSAGWILPFAPIALWTALGSGGDLHFVIWVSMGFCLAMAGVSFWLPHTPPGGLHREADEARELGYSAALARLMRNGNFLVLLLCMFLVSGSFSIMTYYSPAYLEVAGISRPWIGPIQALAVVAEIAFFRWQPVVIRRFNYAPVMLFGTGALCVRHLFYSVSSNPWVLTLSYVLGGAVIVFFHIVASMLINTMAGRAVRSTAQTMLVFFSSGLGPLFANWIAGRLSAAHDNSLQPVFILAAGLAGLATVLIGARAGHLNRAGAEE